MAACNSASSCARFLCQFVSHRVLDADGGGAVVVEGAVVVPVHNARLVSVGAYLGLKIGL